MAETHWVTKTKKDTNDLQKTDKNDAMYTISLAENKHRATPISLSQKLKVTLKRMVIENNSGIEGRSKKLPEYTLVINDPLMGDKNNNFNQSKEYLSPDFPQCLMKTSKKTAPMGKPKLNKINNSIDDINEALGIKLTYSKENALTIDGVEATEQSHLLTYSLSKDDATKLHLLGVPMITYNNTAKNTAVVKNLDVKQQNPNFVNGFDEARKKGKVSTSGKVLGGVRKKAIAEASTLVESQSIKL